MPMDHLGTPTELKIGLVLVWLIAQTERYRRILAACSGDAAAADRVFAQVLRADGWRVG
jgi:hypothetical protein